ncbi:hypothetical protein TSTA_044250 [Talaromyces stipitatus ATCC 10500]|uniref:Thioester reductase (TE) domain-containing protein n=1 Tax=Talaromyces stipitatus (strain ATCC 10500 / CBS 375.48 / QM 6759 / NRRL 1006) TaxID=441959 RepID=B8MKW0_TALSN|nr:uncharacterized protein TSTA_044250 [Talaromyces stipitatus ATCC 10500]EED14959.1 hypothetical protein TSTA_044250 [Talaromyces stipitatus ATCC 10500]
MGYSEAKLVCEYMLDEALHRFPSLFRAMAVRIGQISGSNTSGYWCPVEHLAVMLKSSQTLHVLPQLEGGKISSLLSFLDAAGMAGCECGSVIAITTYAQCPASLQKLGNTICNGHKYHEQDNIEL